MEFYEKNKDFVDSCDMFLLSMITMILCKNVKLIMIKLVKFHFNFNFCVDDLRRFAPLLKQKRKIGLYGTRTQTSAMPLQCSTS